MRTDDMIRLLVQDLANQPSSVGTTLLRWWPLAALVAGLSFLTAMGVRPDLASAGLVPTGQKLMLGGLIAATAITGALRLARPESEARSGATWLIAVVVFLGLIVTVDLLRLGTDAWPTRLFGKSIWTCLTLIPTLATLPLAAALLALRHGATRAPATTGTLAGLASAGLAILAYGIFCTEDSPLFIAIWYSLSATIVALAGAVLGRGVLRW